jgi:hypothetical protein
MKKLLLAMLMGLTFAACSDSSTGPSDTAGMSLKINGKSWTAAATSSTKLLGMDVSGSTMGTTPIEMVSVFVKDSVTAGTTYNLGGDTVTTGSFINEGKYMIGDTTWTTLKSRSTGTVKVTDMSGGRIKGTFSFTAFRNGVAGADSIVVTEGSFNTLY